MTEPQVQSPVSLRIREPRPDGRLRMPTPCRREEDNDAGAGRDDTVMSPQTVEVTCARCRGTRWTPVAGDGKRNFQREGAP